MKRLVNIENRSHRTTRLTDSGLSKNSRSQEIKKRELTPPWRLFKFRGVRLNNGRALLVRFNKQFCRPARPHWQIGTSYQDSAAAMTHMAPEFKKPRIQEIKKRELTPP
jgi:hypothetical protein